MEVRYINHKAKILIGQYHLSDLVKKEVFSLLENGSAAISTEDSNVKCTLHTHWDWEPNNITFKNLKSYLLNEAEIFYQPGKMSTGLVYPLKCSNFWGNVYEKGDYAQCHNHRPYDYSFAYFVKCEWYHSPLVFSDSGKKIRPKEGRFVIFPAYLDHHVPVYKHKKNRITLSGNFKVDLSISQPSTLKK